MPALFCRLAVWPQCMLLSTVWITKLELQLALLFAVLINNHPSWCLIVARMQ
jgi:hypothetical protein